ncbi:hypothetical protein GOBAR_DD16988 [Gossypium barbadense]|nr:hypothetical protein GOBAR_DD16988 [Gossypium barbadense]
MAHFIWAKSCTTISEEGERRESEEGNDREIRDHAGGARLEKKPRRGDGKGNSMVVEVYRLQCIMMW